MRLAAVLLHRSTHPSRARALLLPLFALTLVAATHAQDLPLTSTLAPSTVEPLDPTRNAPPPILESATHTPLPEQYIWTARDTSADHKLVYTFPAITEQTEPHFFRAHFDLQQLPHEATLYIAGPRSVSVWINGHLAERVSSDTTSPLGMHVFATSVAEFLQPGENTIAIQAVRGRGVTGFANSALVRQQTFGQVLVAKIIPAAPGVMAPDLMHSDPTWRSTTAAPEGWQQPHFDDASWKPVMSLGGIESNIELFQWNADAGLYNWPGYDGISPFLAHLPMPVAKVLASYSGRGSFTDLDSLTDTHGGDLVVHLPSAQLSDEHAPSLILDFGRELTGRLELISDSDTPIRVTVQLGESESEALKVPYLGINELTIAPYSTGHSPKTAFRYAKIRFLGTDGNAAAPELRFKSIHVDHIYYPVHYLGSFESSDPLLNRIWETGAYTAHLCMQDGLWDAPKRDRGRWMGDTDVSGPVIEDVFADRTLLADTLDRLLGPDHNVPVDQHVNGIPGYSSFWFTGVADFYRHTGDKAFLESEHQRMLELLHVIDDGFDARGLYVNKSKVWLYVDWSPDLNGDTPETRRATTLEFLRAYRQAAYLLAQIGDTANAAKYEARAKQTEEAAKKYLLTPSTDTFGPRWQTNAAAVISGAATPAQYPAIWKDVLSQVGHPAPEGEEWPIMSPYYGDYVLRAMAKMDHRQDALNWMRQYWGGMLDEGASTFWEAYDTRWYKEDFHSSLQADNRSGYFVSLDHGWSAGPTAWLMEQVLGIQPTGPGFATATIRPDLIDLKWARGAMPTPHGLIKVEARREGSGITVTVDLPEGVAATVSVPTTSGKLNLNGKPETSTPTEHNTRREVTLHNAGLYVFTS